VERGEERRGEERRGKEGDLGATYRDVSSHETDISVWFSGYYVARDYILDG
jgi:hypothetical protein